jgi:hypothetical protein
MKNYIWHWHEEGYILRNAIYQEMKHTFCSDDSHTKYGRTQTPWMFTIDVAFPPVASVQDGLQISLVCRLDWTNF